MRKATDQRDAQTISLLWTSLLLFHGGDVASFVVMKLVVGGDEVMWLVVRWRGVSYYGMSCHVMSCHLMWRSCHLMPCDCLCCVMLRDAMRCHVMRAPFDELSSVVPCHGMECYVLKTHWLWGHVVVVLCTTKYYCSTTLYYVVLRSWLNLLTFETSFTMRGVSGVILQLHQILRLPRKMALMMMCDFTQPVLDWAVTLLSCYLTELLLFWAVTLLSCYLTEPVLHWAGTLLSCYFTERYWAVIWLNCYFAELLLY